MIAPTPYFADRGCHVRIYEEARALTKLGHEVCIVTYHLGRDMPGVRVVRTPHIPWYGKLEAGPSWHKPYLDILLLWKALIEAPFIPSPPDSRPSARRSLDRLGSQTPVSYPPAV